MGRYGVQEGACRGDRSPVAGQRRVRSRKGRRAVTGVLAAPEERQHEQGY